VCADVVELQPLEQQKNISKSTIQTGECADARMMMMLLLLLLLLLWCTYLPNLVLAHRVRDVAFVLEYHKAGPHQTLVD
jgi:hypothetical protein